jgi:hypothetical protein
VTLVENERIKLAATALNNIAVASVAAAVIGPSAAYFYGGAAPFVARVAIVWLAVGIGFHWLARTILGGLKP